MAERMFQLLKQTFLQKVTLERPLKNKKYILFVDSSDKCAGASLCQEIKADDLRLIHMASKVYKTHQLAWTVTEKECFSARWAVEKFRSYIYGEKCEIRTDHRSLVFLQKSQFLNQRLTRWFLYLQSFDLNFVYIKGSENKLADYASRVDISKQAQSLDTLIATAAFKQNNTFESKLKNIGFWQDKDEHVRDVKNRVKLSPVKNFFLFNNVLYKNNLVVVPDLLINSLIVYIHERYGHFGIFKTMNTICEQFTFHKMRHRVAQILKTCDLCQKCKHDNVNNKAPMQNVIPEGPRDLLSIDFVGPLPKARLGYEYLLTLMDVFTKFIIIVPVKKERKVVMY